MATALPISSDLACLICFRSINTPKILSCGHSFCRECLNRLIDGKKGTIPCPFCKQNVKIPQGGVDRFTTNFSLQSLTESSNIKPKDYCPNHSQKEVEYYCQTCELGLCSKCILENHTGHKTLDLEREEVVQELTKSEQLIKKKIEDLEKNLATLLETSEKLKSSCDEACTKISEKTERIIGELKENCEQRQKKHRDNFNKNESKLTETRQNVMTQIQNIETTLYACRPTTEEPTLTLRKYVTKLQDLQKLCENMKTDIPTVTSNDEFRFNYKDMKGNNEYYYSKDKYIKHGMVWSCKVVRINYNRSVPTNIYIDFLPENNPRVRSCKIEYTVTLINKNTDQNIISKTWFGDNVGSNMSIQWNKLTDPSEGFIDNEGQFLVRLDILQVLDIEYYSHKT